MSDCHDAHCGCHAFDASPERYLEASIVKDDHSSALTFWSAALSAKRGHFLIQLHDYDGSLLRAFHRWANENGQLVNIYGAGGHHSHEVKLEDGRGALIVHDSNETWPRTDAWRPSDGGQP